MRKLFISRRINLTLALLLLGGGLSAAVGKLPTALISRVVKTVKVAPVSSAPRPNLRSPQMAVEAAVTTDKTDYLPGQTAIITGTGFGAGETVTLKVEHADDTEEGGEGHGSWNVTADANGNFTSSWYVHPDDSLGSTFLLTAVGQSSGLTAQTTFTDNAAANLDQCRNNSPCTQAGGGWVNGNAGASNSHYSEGDSLPYRTRFLDLVAGATYTLTIEYDTTQGGKHAIDYLTTYNRTEVTADPCTGVSGVPTCGSPTTYPIPLDPNVSGAGVTQLPGQVFTAYNATISAVSPYTLTGSYGGNSSTSLTITFSPTANGAAVIAWAGRVATRVDWGITNSAIAINGAPYHMRLLDFTCSNEANCGVGNQDRSLSADAVFFPVTLTIVKETNPDGAPERTFDYTTTGTDLSPFSLTPPNGTTSRSKVFSSLGDETARSVTESDPSPEFSLTSLSCTQTDGGLGVGTFTTNLGTRTVSFTPKEGQSITCTYVNTENFNVTKGRIVVQKTTVPNTDATSFAFTPSYNGGSGFNLAHGQSNDSCGAGNNCLSPGNGYSVTETPNADYVTTASCGVGGGGTFDATTGALTGIQVTAGQTTTCTFTNTKKAKLTVNKVLVPSGDSGTFDLSINGTTHATGVGDGGTTGAQVANIGSNSFGEAAGGGTSLSDYTTAISGAGCTDNGDGTGAITLAAGDSKTCTITNTRQPRLEVVKKIVGGNGTSDAFDVKVDGVTKLNDAVSTAPAGTSSGQFNSTIGAHAVTETFGDGTTAVSSDWIVQYGDDCDSSGNVTLAAGDVKKCTITNTKKPRLTVNKVLAPSNDTGKFNLQIDGVTAGTGTNVGDGGTTGAQVVSIGSHTVGETAGAGTSLSDYDAVISGDCASDGSITLAAGDSKTCTITNTKRGHIIIDKVTNPSGDTQSFTFTPSYNGGATFNLTDGAAPNDSGGLAPGSYSVSEAAVAGWDLTGATCSDNSPVNAISLQAGETVTCTFTNTKRGSITVDKVTTPSGSLTSFNFAVAGGPDSVNDTFGLTDAATPHVTSNIKPGNYTITETVPSDWDLTSATCSRNGDAPASYTNGATIALNAGDSLSCTFNDRQKGSIVVRKVTDPVSDTTTSFGFTAGGGLSPTSFNLTGGGTPRTFSNLTPGSGYSVAETVPTDWNLTSAVCDDGSDPSNIDVGAGETVTCTFTNTKRGHIIVDKVTEPGGDTQSFTFNTTGTGYSGFSLTDAAAPNDQSLAPGSYSVSEAAVAGWDLTGATCAKNGGTAAAYTGGSNIVLAAGDTVRCTFTNTKRGSITITKDAIPNDAQDFSFTGGLGAFSLDDDADPTLPNSMTFSNLVPNTYSVSEGAVAGWDLTGATCSDGSPVGAISLQAGESITCVFTNTKRGKAQVVKTVGGVAPSGAQAFTFQLRQGASAIDNGTTLETLVANVGNGGTINFTTTLVPGQTYQMCEIVMPGWLTSLGTFVPGGFNPPDGTVPNPNVDNSILCVNFTVQPGETKTFAVDNTPPPGGRALTIGFWKNWASCSSSKGQGQKPVLDQTLYTATAAQSVGLIVSAQYLGAGWSLYAPAYYLQLKGGSSPDVATDCTKAVNLLSKSTTDGRKKMSSDPLFNMAAQLVAAQLNYFAGAGRNGTTTMNIDSAVLLLGRYKFNGSTYTPKLNAGDTTKANCLATQLDNYNNNRPVSSCPSGGTDPPGTKVPREVSQPCITISHIW